MIVLWIRTQVAAPRVDSLPSRSRSIMLSPDSRLAVMHRLPFVRAPRLPESSPELRSVICETFPGAHLGAQRSPAIRLAELPSCKQWEARQGAQEMTELRLPKQRRPARSAAASHNQATSFPSATCQQEVVPSEQLGGSPLNFRISELLAAQPSPHSQRHMADVVQPVHASPCSRLEEAPIPRFGRVSGQGWVPPS